MNARKEKRERGSIVLFALFVCLAIAVLVQTLSVVIVCADRGKAAEDHGRQLMRDKDLALTDVRRELLSAWAPRGWSPSPEGSGDVRTAVADLPESGGWALAATASHAADVSPITVSAWVERGRDGLDLPLAGLVAETATWTSGRETPWLEMEDGAGAAGSDGGGADGRPLAWLCATPQTPSFGPGVTLGSLASPWRRDEGWRRLFDAQGAVDSGVNGLAPGSGVCVLGGGAGTTVALPPGWGARGGEQALIVVTGGASLNATGRGDLYGVIVVDEGSVLLEGTRIHGAVFATGTVDFGSSGEVLFLPDTLRWATDRSLARSRLVPGSRRESIE